MIVLQTRTENWCYDSVTSGCGYINKTFLKTSTMSTFNINDIVLYNNTYIGRVVNSSLTGGHCLVYFGYNQFPGCYDITDSDSRIYGIPSDSKRAYKLLNYDTLIKLNEFHVGDLVDYKYTYNRTTYYGKIHDILLPRADDKEIQFLVKFDDAPFCWSPSRSDIIDYKCIPDKKIYYWCGQEELELRSSNLTTVNQTHNFIVNDIVEFNYYDTVHTGVVVKIQSDENDYLINVHSTISSISHQGKNRELHYKTGLYISSDKLKYIGHYTLKVGDEVSLNNSNNLFTIAQINYITGRVVLENSIIKKIDVGDITALVLQKASQSLTNTLLNNSNQSQHGSSIKVCRTIGTIRQGQTITGHSVRGRAGKTAITIGHFDNPTISI